MRACFGCLEEAALTLEPGLNVIQGPNGWGKSTWCAFLEAMLYGLDEDGKTYIPWSGGPMKGTVELSIQGREITLERDFLADTFRAFDKGTGAPVPELTAENCALQLLKVDRDTYAGITGKRQLPQEGEPAQEEACLEKGLTQAEGSCREELAEVSAALDRCRKTLLDRQNLEDQKNRLESRYQEADSFRRRLEQTLDGAKHGPGSPERRRLQKSYERTFREKERLEAFTRTLPSREEAEKRAEDLRSWLAAGSAAEKAAKELGQMPEEPVCVPAFRGLDLRQAQEKAEQDAAQYRDSVGSTSLLLLMLGLLGLLGGCITAFPLQNLPLGLAVMGLGALLLAGAIVFSGQGRHRQSELGQDYGTQDWRLWPELAERYARERMAYEEALSQWTRRKNAARQRLEELERQKEQLCEGKTPEEMLELCRQVTQSWDALDEAARQLREVELQLECLPEEGETLGLNRDETLRCLDKTVQDLEEIGLDLEEINRTLRRLDSREALERQLQQAQAREDTLLRGRKAIALAMTALEQTREERESAVSREEARCFTALTGQTREALRNPGSGTGDAWRFAGCLALAKAQAPEMPLVLDDCLARFDEARTQKALALLTAEAQTRQILLFCCRRV